MELLRGVDVTLGARSITALVGESGSGKTLTALAVMGLLPAGLSVTRGSAVLATGEDVLGTASQEQHRWRGSVLGMVFQDPFASLNPMCRVGDLLEHVLAAHHQTRPGAALDALARVRIGDPQRCLGLWPHQLSGGMRQRVLLAAALCPGPAVLLADEPTTALDVTVQADLMDLLGNLCSQDGLSVLFITHDLALMAAHAQQVAVMYAGHVVECGPTAALLRTPAHPYTRMLLASRPTLLPPVHPQDRLPTLAGAPPTPGAWPSGCAFAPRCSRVLPVCEAQAPSMHTLSAAIPGDHQVSCHNPLWECP